MATRDYTLGKGKVLFKKSGDASYLDLGNAPAFTITVTIDKLEHFSSRSGLSKKDLEVITKLGVGGSFTLDEPNAQNLAMFVMADGTTDDSQTAGTAGAFDSLANTVAGTWYPLEKSAVRVYNVTVLAITTPATAVEGTDYLLDAAAGLIYIMPNGTLDGAVSVVFGATCNYGAQTRTAAAGGTMTSLTGDLYFVGDPPQGRIVDIMGFCSLTPNGDFALIGEDWMQIQFNVEFLEVTGVDGLVQVVDRGKAGTL